MLKESEITALVKPNGDIVELKGVDELAKKFENFSEAELQGVKTILKKMPLKVVSSNHLNGIRKKK